MADPEIQLPMTSSQLELRNSRSGSGDHPGISTINPERQRHNSEAPTFNADVEKNQEKSKDDIDEDEFDEIETSEIVWRYLNVDTPLPNPTSVHPSREGQEQPPAPPDLTKYISPFEWSKFRKNSILWISCIITSLTAFSAGSYSPGTGQMSSEWHISNVAALVGITVFTCGFAIGPMFLAPFSEIQGRRPVFIVSGILFVICQLCTGLTRSYAGMLVVRFFVGIGGSTFSTMVGGVVSDIYHTQDRNTPMAVFSGSALFGTGLGPLVCGFIAQNTSWRWIFYMQAITCCLMVGVICVVFKETRGSVLLSRKAKCLNKYYEQREAAGYFGFNVPDLEKPGSSIAQRIRWKVKADEERASISKMIGISLYRPFHLLITEPVVFWFSLWVSFSWAVLYLTLAAVPLVFMRNHAFSLQQANAVFAATCVGSVLATFIAIYQEKIAIKKGWGKLLDNPEGRLYFACIESALMPIGMFMFGWTSFSDIHWIAPSIAIALATMGIFAIYLAVFNYLADTYHRYASSALAAQSFCRNMLGGAFPLITTQMYNRLGFGAASSLLGGIGILLTVVPWILVFYGPRIRARSKFASDQAKASA